MIVDLTISGFYIDKPISKTIEIDDESPAVQLPNGEVLKVKQLKGDARDQFFYEKYIKDTGMEGRILNIEYR